MACSFAWAWRDLSQAELFAMPSWYGGYASTPNLSATGIFAGPLSISYTRYCLRTYSWYAIQKTLPATQDKGWFVFRWRHGSATTTGYYLGALTDGPLATVRIGVRASTSNLANSTLNLYVNGTLVGTSTTAVGSSESLIAVKYDLSIATAAAGLWINGVQEVGVGGALVAGSGGTQTIDGLYFAGGYSYPYYNYVGDIIMYDSLADAGERTGVHLVPLDPTDDVLTTGWTSTGANFFGEMDDYAATTYAQSVVDPTGPLELGHQERADVDALWTGGTFDAIVTYHHAVGDGALTSATIGVNAGATNPTEVVVLTIVSEAHAHVMAVDPVTGVAWTGAGVDALVTTIEVT